MTINQDSITFRKKICILMVIILFLLLILTGTYILDPERSAARNSNYAWLNKKYTDYIDRIEIYGSGKSITLIRKNNVWVLRDTGIGGRTIDYPVRQIRAEDLLADLCRYGNYPVRSVSAASQEIYGLGNDAQRIIIHGGAGPPLLDLLIGYTDLTGGIFLRKAGLGEIRSGEDIFSVYTNSDKIFWYDLRIFPDVNPDMVQRIYFIDENTGTIIARSGAEWIDETTGSVLQDGQSVLRTVLDARAEDFTDSADWAVCKNIILELGNGTASILAIGPPDINGSCPAKTRDTEILYLLSEQTIRRLFRL